MRVCLIIYVAANGIFLAPFWLSTIPLGILFPMNEWWCSLSQCWMLCVYLVEGKFYSGLSPFFSFELLVVCFFCLVSVVELLILEAHPGLGFGMCIKYLCRVHGQMQKLSYFGEQLRELSLKRSHETPSFSFRGSLFSSFYASCMKTWPKARLGIFRMVYGLSKRNLS